jgi:hypothetical protein
MLSLHRKCREPIPTSVLQIVWRRGLDLNPVDINDREQASWLESLVWPEQTGRAARLRAAIEIARPAPTLVLRGDLLTDLPTLAASAPPDATLVIFHSAVLGYLVARGDRVVCRHREPITGSLDQQ